MSTTIAYLAFTALGIFLVMTFLHKIGLFKTHTTEVQTSVEIIHYPSKEHPGEDYLAREHVMIYQFSMANPMKYPWLYNRARFKTKKQALAFKKLLENRGNEQADEELKKLKEFAKTTCMLRGAK